MKTALDIGRHAGVERSVGAADNVQRIHAKDLTILYSRTIEGDRALIDA